MMGRRPKPTAVKELAGNPGRRPLNPAEPKFEGRAPQCPRNLGEMAKREWRRVAAALEGQGMLTRVDRAALAMYCQTWATWCKAEEMCETQGDVIETTNGNLIQNPWRGIANRSLRLCQGLAAEFGMTPSARSRVHTGKTEADESLAESLFKSVKAMRAEREGAGE